MTVAIQKSKRVGQHTHRDHLQVHLHPGLQPLWKRVIAPYAWFTVVAGEMLHLRSL